MDENFKIVDGSYGNVKTVAWRTTVTGGSKNFRHWTVIYVMVFARANIFFFVTSSWLVGEMIWVVPSLFSGLKSTHVEEATGATEYKTRKNYNYNSSPSKREVLHYWPN